MCVCVWGGGVESGVDTLQVAMHTPSEFLGMDQLDFQTQSLFPVTLLAAIFLWWRFGPSEHMQ